VEDNNGSEIRMLFEDNGYRFLGDVAHNLLFHRAID
jgi:hypothetical protein